MPEVRESYGFEKAVLAERAALFDEGNRYYNTFLKNLNLRDRDLSKSARRQLRGYVAAVHINTDWYNRRIKGEIARQIVFLAISFALLILVPLFVYRMGFHTGAIGGQVATTLAGLYAVHRAAYGWMKRRSLVAPYWRARSNLMNEIYGIETEWLLRKKIDDDGDLKSEFLDAVKTSITRSRAFVLEADERFFSS